MPLKNDLLSELSSILGDEARLVLNQNVPNDLKNIPYKSKFGSDAIGGNVLSEYRTKSNAPRKVGSALPPPSPAKIKFRTKIESDVDKKIRIKLVKRLIGQYIMIVLFLAGLTIIIYLILAQFNLLSHPSTELSTKSWNPGLFKILLLVLLVIAVVFFIHWLLFRSHKFFEKAFFPNKSKLYKVYPELSKEKTVETIEDEVYIVISTSYDELSTLRIERERQARLAFNTALFLIIVGIIIVFFGVYLLFMKKVTEGSITSGIGGISNIIGGTILNLYRNTNDRMDKLNGDLFILNTAKVQYAIILRINDISKRDAEMAKLIDSIGHIKK